jgi:hypothetical protein
MASIAVSSSLGPGHVVVVPCGKLDVTGATLFARALSVAAAPQQPVARLLSLIDLTGRLINWLIAAARSVAVKWGLLLRPDRSLEPFGPVGPSVQSTTMAI